MSSADEAFAQGNEAFINDEYESALELYNRAISSNAANANFYDKRAAAHLKLKHFNEALADANSALAIEPTSNSALHRRGTALFQLDRFDEAKTAFTAAERYGNKQAQLAIRKCDAELSRIQTQTPQTAVAATPVPTAAPVTPAAATSSVPSGPLNGKVTFSFYQSASTVTLTIYAKNCRKDSVSVTLSPTIPTELSAKLTLPDDTSIRADFPSLRARSAATPHRRHRLQGGSDHDEGAEGRLAAVGDGGGRTADRCERR